MYLVFHPKVYSDIDEIMEYYERVATRELAAEILLRTTILHAAGRRAA